MMPSVRSVTTSYPLDLWKEAVASCLHGSLQILGLWEAEVVSLARIHPETFGGLWRRVDRSPGPCPAMWSIQPVTHVSFPLASSPMTGLEAFLAPKWNGRKLWALEFADNNSEELNTSNKEFASQCRRPRFNPWVGKIPWRREWQPMPELLPGKILWTEEPGRL